MCEMSGDSGSIFEPPTTQPKPIRRVYDESGALIAIEKSDGSLIPNPDSTKGHKVLAWNSELPPQAYARRKAMGRDLKEFVGVVVWDGGCRQQITGWYDSKTPGAPRGGLPLLYFQGGSGE